METKDLDKLIADYTIVIYDGVCGFCDTSVQFILERKPSSTMRFVSFQSEIGQQLLKKYQYSSTPETILCIENGVLLQKSEAVFSIVKYLQSPLKYLQYLRWIPTAISNFLYDIIAKYRYHIKGKIEQCRLLNAQERHYFLE